MKDCNLFFFDTETGGLNPAQADMIEVACVLTDPTGHGIIEQYCVKVLPVRPVDPRAAQVNGYTAEKWAAEAISLDAAMVKLLTMARDSVMVAHNAPFDWGFLTSAMAKRGQRWPGDFHRIDTVALATPLLKAGLVENLKLPTLTKYFGISHDDAHTALSDVRACRQLYLTLMDKYNPVLCGEYSRVV